MDELNALLDPVWEVQATIRDLWHHLCSDEKQIIKTRMETLFSNGLPFELQHNKLVYIHLFSALAQIDIMACQVPLKFEHSLPTIALRQQLRAQLLDEIFHVLLSIKIVYLLCDADMPLPHLNDNFAQFCAFVSHESCPKMALVLLNLVAEGIAEEMTKALHRANFAPAVIDIILRDERRHVSDADLYREIGLPDQKTMMAKMEIIENFLTNTLFLQYHFGLSMISAVGLLGLREFLLSVNEQYSLQLKKLDLKPGNKWQSSIKIMADMLDHIEKEKFIAPEVPMNAHRRATLMQWSDPMDPTMVGQFSLDITCLDFFNKKYPPETLTTLILQTMSLVMETNPEYQLFIQNGKMYRRHDSYVSLVVKLPGCDNHLGLITFENCHRISTQALSQRIRTVMMMMTYCYQKTACLEQEHPHLLQLQENILQEMKSPFSSTLPLPLGICLSNIGMTGYSQAKSPLLPNEPAKVTLLSVERKPVWSHETQAFEPRDLLPITVSVDHRLFDGNLPLPKVMEKSFQTMFQQFAENPVQSSTTHSSAQETLMKTSIDKLLQGNLEMGYVTLSLFQTIWLDYLFTDEQREFPSIKSILKAKSVLG